MIFVSAMALLCNLIVFISDKKSEVQVLNEKEPMEAFERLTQIRMTVRESMAPTGFKSTFFARKTNSRIT